MEDIQETLENENTLSAEEMKSLVVIGRALADPTRIRILGLLAERPMYGQELAKVLDVRSEEHTSELQSQSNLVCRLLLEKKKKTKNADNTNFNKLFIM